jgi:hypothetical protein
VTIGLRAQNTQSPKTTIKTFQLRGEKSAAQQLSPFYGGKNIKAPHAAVHPEVVGEFLCRQPRNPTPPSLQGQKN